MPGSNEKIGLDAIWNNTEYLKGQAQYIKKLLEANQETNQFSQATGQTSTAGMLKMGAALGVGAAAVQGLISVVKSAISSVYELGASAIMTASRVQQLNLIARTLGNNAGYTSAEIDGVVNSIRKQGISMGVANNVAANFLKAQLDLTKASELARVAQDAATLSNEGSSDALENIIYGITTLSPIVLRHHGIMVNLEVAYKNYAETMGITGRDLTVFEKQQAALNATLEYGTNITGAYQASMQTAGKQLGTLKSRLLPDLLATMGAPFQDAFYRAVLAINEFVKALITTFSEGGKLYPLMQDLGAIASILADLFLGASRVVSGAITSLENVFAGSFGNIADIVSQGSENIGVTIESSLQRIVYNAFAWGYNLITQFANGMLQSAGTNLMTVIQQIGNVIAGWFSPGSPPKVAPEIDKWGLSTVNEWLKGFTKGDYSILDSIQGPIQSALGALVDLGELGQGDANKMFGDLSKQLIEGLSSGNLDASFYDQLASGLGQFGVEIADLTKKQLALEQSEKQVAQAEKDLADARERQSKAGAAVNAETIKYNQLLRGGATDEELAAQKKKIDLANEQYNQAKKDEGVAQDKLDAAKAQQEALKEQVDLQTKLIQQLIELAKIQKDVSKGPKLEGIGDLAGGGGGGLGSLGGLDTQDLETQGEEAASNLASPFEKVKKRIIDLVSELWENLKAQFQTGIDSIRQKIQPFLDAVKGWWERHGESVKTIVSSFIQGTGTLIKIALQIWKGWWEKHGVVVKARWKVTWEAIKTIFGNNLEIIGDLLDAWAALFKGDWETFKSKIIEAAKLLWTNVKLAFSVGFGNLLAVLGIGLQDMKDSITIGFNFYLDKAREIFANIKLAIQTKISEIALAIQTKIGEIQAKWNEIWLAVQTKASEIWTSIQTFITTTLENLFASMGLDLDTMKERWSAIWEDIKLILTLAWNYLVYIIQTKIAEAKAWIETTITSIQTKWGEIWDSISSKVSEIWDTIYGTITGKVDEAKGYVDEQTTELQTRWGEIWDSISQKISDIWDEIIGSVTDKLTGEGGLISTITTKVEEILTNLGGYVEKFKTAGSDLIAGMKQGVLDSVGDLIESVTQAIEDAIAAAKLALGITSPSKVFASIGRNTMAGMAIGVQQARYQPIGETAAAAAGVIGAAARVPIMTGNTYNRTLQLNMTNQVGNGIDVAMLDAHIRQVVRQEFK